MNTHIFTNRIDWNGITLEVSWEPEWLSRRSAPYRVGHIQITSIAPENAPLPVSETGYRSLFIDPKTVVDEGGPVNFARAWLDHEARSAAWRAHVADARQLALF